MYYICVCGGERERVFARALVLIAALEFLNVSWVIRYCILFECFCKNCLLYKIN